MEKKERTLKEMYNDVLVAKDSADKTSKEITELFDNKNDEGFFYEIAFNFLLPFGLKTFDRGSIKQELTKGKESSCNNILKNYKIKKGKVILKKDLIKHHVNMLFEQGLILFFSVLSRSNSKTASDIQKNLFDAFLRDFSLIVKLNIKDLNIKMLHSINRKNPLDDLKDKQVNNTIN